MKIKTFIAISIFCAVSGIAQDSLISDGNFLGSGPGPSYSTEIRRPTEWDSNEYRKINNRPLRVTSTNGWSIFRHQIILSVENDGAIIQPYKFNGAINVFHQYIFIKDLPGSSSEYVDRQKINFCAYPNGITDTSYGRLQVWDCGISCPAPPPSKEEIAAGLARMEAIEKAIAVRQLKAYLVQSNAVEWLKPQATNGDASAQCSLGLHYLNGIGCKKDCALALFWLRAASDNGDIEASNKLVSVASK